MTSGAAPDFGKIGLDQDFKGRCRAADDGCKDMSSVLECSKRVSKRRHTRVDLDAAPVQRVGHVVPDIGFVGEEEHVIEAHTASCNGNQSDT